MTATPLEWLARLQGDAERALQAGSPHRAEELLRQALAVRPEEGRLLNSLGQALARQKKLKDAVDCYRRAIAAWPEAAKPQANLGDALCQMGRLEEGLQAYQAALALDPALVEAQFNKANALRALGRPAEAVAAYRAALRVAPQAPSLLINLGGLLSEMGEPEEAEGHLRRALEIEPGSTLAQSNLAVVLRQQGRAEEAVALLRRLTLAQPDFAQGHLHLAQCLILLKRWDEARPAAERALALQPGLADAYVALGEIWKAERRWHEAMDAYLSALRLKPELAELRLHYKMGLECLEAGDFEDAAAAMLAPVRLLRGPNMVPPPDTLLESSRVKLIHDREQLRHLQDVGILGRSFDAVIAEYGAALAAAEAGEDNRLAGLGARAYPLVVANATRLNHLAAAPALPGGALNERLDGAAVEAAYRACGLGATYVDGLLKPEALARLRDFCNRSTVWWQLEHTCELGSLLHKGFACPLLIQIAHDLRHALPGLLGPHRFTSLWAYKYFATPDQKLAHDRSSGLDVHADDGAVTVNFWIAPDEGNLDPECGGIRLWDREAPPEYFTTTNRDQRLKIVAALMKDAGPPSLVVPHRANRAAIFHSNSLHMSDNFRFKDAYLNRKISITLMFGQRANKA